MIRTDVWLKQNADTTRVHILELGQVIDLAVNNDPLANRREQILSPSPTNPGAYIPGLRLCYAAKEWSSLGERCRDDSEKTGLTDSTSWRVKTLVDMVDGGEGEGDVICERRNTVGLV